MSLAKDPVCKIFTLPPSRNQTLAMLTRISETTLASDQNAAEIFKLFVILGKDSTSLGFSFPIYQNTIIIMSAC